MLDKGTELSMNVLSQTMQKNLNAYGAEIINALNIYARATTGSGYYTSTQNGNVKNLFTVENLKKFFAKNDISSIGNYNSSSEIFKRK